jgi:hypothetical protein
MKNVIIILIAIFMASCGKEYNFVCTTYAPSKAPVTIEKEMTEREARRYEKKHCKNSDGVDYIIASDETQTNCTKK